jgi:hypothetical protein
LAPGGWGGGGGGGTTATTGDYEGADLFGERGGGCENPRVAYTILWGCTAGTSGRLARIKYVGTA